MSRVEREPEVVKPLDVGPGMLGPGPDELVASGDIDEPVPQGMFLELLSLMATLKGRRQARGLSLTDVSGRSGLTRQAISRLENGWNNNPTLETLYRYALALDAGVTLGVEEFEPEDDGRDEDTPAVTQEDPAGGRPRPIVVEFVGGFMDGKRLSTAADDPDEVQEAAAHYVMSSEGTVGKRFRTYSDAGRAELAEITEMTPEGPRLKREPVYDMDHFYEVVERVETGESIIVRFRFAGRSVPENPS
jgi:transcriptional regulator with XRE-family HTH domain